MKTSFICAAILAVFAAGALAGDTSVITPEDGSVAEGEVNAARNEAVRLKADEVQNQIIGDPELMQMVTGMMSDPAFSQLLSDPEIAAAAGSGNVEALISNPKFLQLLDNPQMQAIKDKVQSR